MTEEHLNAPEATESTPTTQLPEPEPMLETEAEAEVTAEAEAELAAEGEFEQEHRQEQDAAVASLDETVLRPFVTPIDLGPVEEERPSRPPVPWQSATQTPPALPGFSWRRLGVAAVLAAIALAMGVRSAGSRQTHVGLFGVTTPTEQATPKIATPVQVAPVETAEPEEESYGEEEYAAEEEPAEEAPSEDWISEEETDEDGRSSEDSPRHGPHTFTWDFGDSTGHDTGSEDEDAPDENPDETDGYYSYINRDDSWDDTDDSSSDGSVSWEFDGGNVTYYYDDRTVTVDWDVIDEIERYLDTYDSWGYGVPGGEQGYGNGYGGRDHSRDRGTDYYYYGW